MSAQVQKFDPEIYAKSLAKKYETLVKHAWIWNQPTLNFLGSLVKPYFFATKSDGIKSIWERARQLIFSFAAPLRAESFGAAILQVSYSFPFVWICILLFLFMLTWPIQHAVRTPSTFSANDQVVAIAFSVVDYIFFFVAVFRWFSFFSEKTKSSIAKLDFFSQKMSLSAIQNILSCISLILGFMFFATSPLWLPGTLRIPQLVPLMAPFYFKDLNIFSGFVVLFFPPVTFLILGILDLGVWCVWFVSALRHGVQFFHKPFFTEQILRVAFTPVSAQYEDCPKWSLFTLAQEEVDDIYELAKTNLEGSDKRFWLVVLFLAFLPLLVPTLASLPQNTLWLAEIWNAILEVISGYFPGFWGWAIKSVGWVLGISLSVAFILMILNGVFELLANVAAHHIIANACIIVKSTQSAQRAAEERAAAKNNSPKKLVVVSPPPFRSKNLLIRLCQKFGEFFCPPRQ